MAKAFLMICAVLIFPSAVALGQTPTATPDCGEMKTRLERAETTLRDWPALARYRDDK
jgi:hypothetical protein